MILVLLYIRIRQQQYTWLLLLPVALLLFQFRAFEIVLWAQAALAYFFVFLYGFCCIYALHNITAGRFALAIVFAVLTCFSLASGQLIWLLGLASLLHQSLTYKKVSAGYALCWAVIAALVLTLWHWNMVDVTASREGSAFLTDKTVGLSLFAVAVHNVHFFLVLLGSAVTSTSTLAASIAGAVLLSVLATVSISSCKDSDIRLELCSWYLVFSAAAIAVGRGKFFLADYALSSRYSIPSLLMFACVWLLIALRVKKYQPLILALGVVLAGIYSVTSYRTYPALLQTSVNSRIKLFNQGQHPVMLQDASATVREATALGIYNPPPSPQPLCHINQHPIALRAVSPQPPN